MSDAESPSVPPPVPPSPGRSGCLTALMVVVGVILLLPGLCAVIFGGIGLSQPHFDSGFMPFVLMGLLVGCVGVAMIWAAFRRPQP